MTKDDEFDDAIDELHARIDLQNEHCHLKHSEEDPSENHPAVDYLCQDFGQEASTDVGHAINETLVAYTLRVPICQECMEALLGDEWILLYCVHCNNSQWVSRKYAKYHYPFWLHIKWMDACPVCHEVKLKLERP